MSDAATPETGPAGVTRADADAVLAVLVRDSGPAPGGQEADDTDAAPDARQPTSGAQAEDPDAGDDQSQAAEPEQDEQQEPPRYRVKVRGEEVEVPLPELLNGYSRTEDYKAKTAELAEQRRAAERAQADFTARVQALDAMLAQAPQDPILAEGQTRDWVKFAEEHPAEYVAARAAYEARVAQYTEAARLRADAQASEYARQWQQAEAEMAKVSPDWRSDEGKRAAKARIVSTLREAGFRDEEIASVSDPRIIRLLDTVAAAKAQAAARQSAEQKRAPAAPPRTMRPGTGNQGQPTGDTRALLNRAKSATRLDDAADAVLALLAR